MKISSAIGCVVAALAASTGAAAAAASPAQASDLHADPAGQIASSAEECLKGFAVPLFNPLRGKLASRGADASEAMLALKIEPTQGESFALRIWIQTVTLCRQSVLSTARDVGAAPEEIAVLSVAWEREIGKLLELYEAMIPYGEYNGWLKQAEAQTDAALRSVSADLQGGTPEARARAAATVAQQTRQLQDQIKNYNARLALWQQAARDRGLAPSCTALGAFTLCSP